MSIIINAELINSALVDTLTNQNLHSLTIDVLASQPEVTTWEVYIGTLYGFTINVQVNGEPAVVESSQWQLTGSIVNSQQAIVSSDRSYLPLLDNPTLAGGYNNNPATIIAAWASPAGEYKVTIRGTAVFNGENFPFESNATVVASSPRAIPSSLSSEEPEIDGSIGIYHDAAEGPTLGFDGLHAEGFVWSAEVDSSSTTNTGYFMFSQIIGESIVSRRSTSGQQQSRGIATGTLALDGGEEVNNNLFIPAYDANEEEPSYQQLPGEGEFDIDDGPFEPLFEDDPKFPGLSFDYYERHDTFIAYIVFVPATDEHVTGYPMALESVDWGWSGTAELQGSSWTVTDSSILPLESHEFGSAPELLEWSANGDNDSFSTWHNDS